MNDKINWKVHIKRQHNRRYAQFENQMVVIVTSGGENFGLSKRSWESIGSPEAVLILTEPSGTMIGFRRSSLSDMNAYKVGNNTSPSLRYVSAKAFVADHPILKGMTDAPKVWIAHMEDDTLVVNLLNNPTTT